MRVQGIFATIKEGFRSHLGELFTTSRGISDVLLDKVNNPTPRSELFPYRFYDDKEDIYYVGGDIAGFIFECTPLVGINNDLYKQISMLFDDQLPFGGVVEILLLASDDLRPVISKWKGARVQKQGVFEKLQNYRSEFFNNYNKQEDINFKHRNYRLFISYSSKLDSKKGREKGTYHKQDSDNSIAKIIKFKGRLKTILSGIGIEPQTVKPGAFLGLIKEIMNYPNFSNTSYREEESLADQISDRICDVSNALLVSEDGVLLDGGRYASRAYEVTDYPEEFDIGRMPYLLGDTDSDNMQIPCRFGIVYTIANEVTSTNQEAYKKKGEVVIKQADSKLEKINRIIKEEGKEWSQIIENNLKQKERFLRATFLVMITANAERIEHAEQSLMSLWRKHDFIIKGLKYFHLPGLLSFCPFLNNGGLGKTLRDFGIKRTVMSSEPKAIIPIHGEWKGSQNGGMILTGGRGQIFTWNNYEGGSNYNACIIGESGSGKSVFLQEFVMSHLAQGTRVFVVDIGRSFEKTCKIMGGDFLSFGSNSKTSLNPFSNIPESEGYDPKVGEDEQEVNVAQDSLNYLKQIIAKMVAPIYGTTDIQNASIALALCEVWGKYKTEANIDKLAEVLSKKGEREKDLGLMLFEYTSRGNYGKFFNGRENIKFDKQLTVLEFEELREQPELGGVIMQMLGIQIVQQVYLGDRRQKFIILFDEAWYALENFPLFLASMAKTVRKYNGALILGTQSLRNFYGNAGKDVVQATMDTARMGVIENSAWRVLLRQSGESSDSLEKMKMPEHLINVVKGLTTSAGNYSEMLIYQSEKQYFVSRLMLDKFSQILYSSSPQIFTKVKAYIDRGMDIGMAVEAVMKERTINRKENGSTF